MQAGVVYTGLVWFTRQYKFRQVMATCMHAESKSMASATSSWCNTQEKQNPRQSYTCAFNQWMPKCKSLGRVWVAYGQVPII